MFQKSIIKVESLLNLKDIIDWIESNPVTLSIFMRFGKIIYN